MPDGHGSVSRAAEMLGADRVFPIDDPARRTDIPSSRMTHTESGVSPTDLAYVIYTSGSTGRPEGVMTEHRHVSLFVDAFNKVCGTGYDDRVYQGFAEFDGSVEEIWMAFSNGSTLVVPTPTADAPRFGDELGQYLSSLGITYFSTVPTMLATMAPSVPSLRTVVLSGDVAPQLVSAWARRGLRILNVYGPTEATVNTTVFECRAGETVTIGRPIDGYTVQIVDDSTPSAPDRRRGRADHHQRHPGARVLQRARADRRQVREHDVPVDRERGRPVARCHRTGDLARWRDDGNLEFLGRADGQVKIRGYRVELSEIQAVLAEHPEVRSASVRLLQRDGLQELAAYVVTRHKHMKIDRHELFSLLEFRVPPS